LLTRRLAGYKDGACFEKGSDEGKIVDYGFQASDMASFSIWIEMMMRLR